MIAGRGDTGLGGACCDLRVKVERAGPSSCTTTRPVACSSVVTYTKVKHHARMYNPVPSLWRHQNRLAYVRNFLRFRVYRSSTNINITISNTVIIIIKVESNDLVRWFVLYIQVSRLSNQGPVSIKYSYTGSIVTSTVPMILWLHLCDKSLRRTWISARIKIRKWTINTEYSESLRAGWFGDRILVEAICSTPIQTGPGSHPASYTLGSGTLSVLAAGTWR